LNPYADTSYLFSLFIADTNTPSALTLRQATADPLPFTALHRLELRNAIHLAVFRKKITAATGQAAWANVEADLQSGALNLLLLNWPDVFGEAEKLAQLHTAAAGSRSLDTLHVAAALAVGTVDFATFDLRQAALAKLAGLNVKP
jgi:hypothetical protein